MSSFFLGLCTDDYFVLRFISTRKFREIYISDDEILEIRDNSHVVEINRRLNYPVKCIMEDGVISFGSCRQNDIVTEICPEEFAQNTDHIFQFTGKIPDGYWLREFPGKIMCMGTEICGPEPGYPICINPKLISQYNGITRGMESVPVKISRVKNPPHVMMYCYIKKEELDYRESNFCRSKFVNYFCHDEKIRYIEVYGKHVVSVRGGMIESISGELASKIFPGKTNLHIVTIGSEFAVEINGPTKIKIIVHIMKHIHFDDHSICVI